MIVKEEEAQSLHRMNERGELKPGGRGRKQVQTSLTLCRSAGGMS